MSSKSSPCQMRENFQIYCETLIFGSYLILGIMAAKVGWLVVLGQKAL